MNALPPLHKHFRYIRIGHLEHTHTHDDYLFYRLICFALQALERVYRVHGDTLEYEIYMAAMAHPLQLHLTGSLQRVAEPVTTAWLRENLKSCTVIDVREPNEYVYRS